MNIKFKKRLYEILEIAAVGDIPNKVFDVCIMTLITLNVAAVILATVESLDSQYQYYFRNRIFPRIPLKIMDLHP